MNGKKKVIDDFEFMIHFAEARAYSKLSLERPLTNAEFCRFKEVCKKIGVGEKR